MRKNKYSLRAIRDIGKSSPDGVVIVDIEAARILYVNKAISQLTGLPKRDLTDQSIDAFRKFFALDPGLMASGIVELKTNARLSNFEFRLDRGNGKFAFVSCDAYLLSDASIAVVFVKDVSPAKQHATYLSDFGAKKDAILDMVAYNLSGPLNVTNNLLDLVDRMSTARQSKQFDSSIRLIRENTQQCIDVINSFLREEHSQSENVVVESTHFDLLSKIRIVISKLKEFNRDKKIFLESKSEEIYIHSDDVKVFQIVHNLLSNAIKFTEEDGKINVTVTDQGERVLVEISDNGIGIPEPLQPHIFRKNTPAMRKGLRGEKPTGIGLYIVKKLVNLLGGDVSFTSEENKGSTFSVVFPKK